MRNQKEVQVIGILDIQRRIMPVRGVQVMLDRDLAALYGVETRALNQAVRRNIGRFPEDFMFQLDRKDVFFLKSQQVSANEYNADLRSQFVTSSRRVHLWSTGT